MKAILAFFFVTILMQSIYCKDISEIKTEFEKQKRDCQASNPVSDDIMEKLSHQELVEDENLKHYIFCLAHTRGFIEDDGKYNIGALQEVYAKFSGNHATDKVIAHCTDHPIIGDGIASYWKLIRCFQLHISGSDFDKMVHFYWV